MRTGRRSFLMALGLVLNAAIAGAAPVDPRPMPAGSSIRMTLDVDWSVPARPSTEPVELAVGDGRVVDVSNPVGTSKARPDGSWEIGPGTRGRARVRVEAPMTTDVIVRVAGQVVRVPLASLLEGPHRTSATAPVEVGIERVAWDAIQADMGTDGFDGTVEPGALVPLSVAFNVLTPEATDVNLHCSAELRPARGGEPVWRQDWQEVVATDAASPAKHALTMTAPGPEGTYLLEIKTSWEPLDGPAGSRLGRWLRRRRNPAQSTSATRRMTLAVVSPLSPAPTAASKGENLGVEVDSIDLTRALGHRPIASGRSPIEGTGRSWSVPEAAMVDPSLRDKFRGWIKRDGVEPSTLATADSTGLAWSAVGLRVPHPERPHRLTLTVSGGHPAALGVALVAGAGPGGRGRVVLDACVSGAPTLEGGPPSTFSWPVWPDAEAPVLVLVNRNPTAPVQFSSITLTELVDLPPAPAPRMGDRTIGLHLAGPLALDRFGGVSAIDGRLDPLAQARNLSTYLAHLGASTVVLPDGLADRSRRKTLEGQADEDSTGPDRLDLILRVLARRGCTAWVDVPFDGPLPGLPAPDSPEAAARGLVRVDRHGVVDGPSYQPIHPEVRRAMAKKVAEAVAPRKSRPNLAGILVRLGPGSTLPGGPDSGLDDATYARFVASAYEPGQAGHVPGRGTTDPNRFEARARFVEAGGRFPWLQWRGQEVADVYTGLADAIRGSSRGAVLAVSTPGLEPGPAADEARRVDLAGLGPMQAWRGVGLNLAAWPTGEGAPIVLRGAGLSTDDLGHDLATSPELDEPVAARASRGSLLGVEGSGQTSKSAGPRLVACPMAEGTSGDEPMGHALASIDATRVIVASSSVAGQEERIRKFARVFTALPASTGRPVDARLPSGVVARPIRSGGETYLAMANDTPYPILLETVLAAPGSATVDDLGRGIRLDPEKKQAGARLVIELPPFGVAATRINSPEVKLASALPYPNQAVLDGMKAHHDDLLTILNRLDRAQGVEPASTFRSLSESERLNARRDVMAALSAYSDKKYGDFARLAGSHWARNVTSTPGTAVATDRSGLIRTGDASALPPGRRLR